MSSYMGGRYWVSMLLLFIFSPQTQHNQPRPVMGPELGSISAIKRGSWTLAVVRTILTLVHSISHDIGSYHAS